MCIYCLGRKVSVTNSLATRYPEIAKEWCYEKNGDLTPDKITYGSNKDVWWRCSKNPNHVYCTSPNDRTYSHRGCPYCNNMKVCSTNNLAVTHPDLAKQWYQARNGELTPDHVLPSYTGKVWWQCSENPEHIWDCPVNYRVRFHWGCPYCKHKRFNDFSLSSLYPSMARDWDYAKNGKDTPLRHLSQQREDRVLEVRAWRGVEAERRGPQELLSERIPPLSDMPGEAENGNGGERQWGSGRGAGPFATRRACKQRGDHGGGGRWKALAHSFLFLQSKRNGQDVCEVR